MNPSALEPNGRTVRCAACKTTWFAKAPSLVLAEAKPEPAAPMPWVSEEDRADHHARAAVAERNAAAISDDAELAQIEHSPSISPGAEEEAPRPKRKTVISGRSTAKAHARRMPLGSVAILLAAVLLLGLAGRQSVVRAAPELASLYATIGLPVNLRGLEFQNIRTKQEIQDGVTVLAIEGEVENIAQGAVELPRVRLAVLGDNGVELYSWTALLPRSILYPHERVPFKSRLASPPAASKEIMVRFLTRRDLMASTR